VSPFFTSLCRSVDLSIDSEIYGALWGVRSFLELELKVVVGDLRTVYQTKNKSHYSQSYNLIVLSSPDNWMFAWSRRDIERIGRNVVVAL
jgi:hypothetical protein